eukprot:CAMPEP_0196572520 /NCGR_PEP_ID=MMETSP1081-20130531/2563_1 /TAXON_ID=36882 /ORGANISM="Pyramimonas amylifera, Strain CCMP720" /LENGTH=345 /DNA_ID=CAMNT_0041889875 /DNA_START=71 /DNA_END=1108 /DNA_ORIENTATION=-
MSFKTLSIFQLVSKPTAPKNFASSRRGAFSVHHKAQTIKGIRSLKAEANKNFAKEVGELQVSENQLVVERYVASNRFRVKPGKEAAFEKRWAERKSRLAELEGFKFFTLLRRVSSDEGEPLQLGPGEPNYASLTVWADKDNFTSWRAGEAFKEAHGGGTLWGFVSMLVSSSQTLEGTPSPAFYHGLLPLQGEQAGSSAPVVGGWRQVIADGVNPITPDCFVAMNRFSVTQGNEAAFETRWASRESKLNEMPGFLYFLILRRDAVKADDGFNYVSFSAWKDRASFEKWRDSQNFQSAHGQKEGLGKMPSTNSPNKPKGPPSGGIMTGPPSVAFYVGKLTLQCEAGL